MPAESQVDAQVRGEGNPTERLAANWGGWEDLESKAAADIPAGRLGRPEEYGDLVAFLCSERAAYITGTSIPIDGGMLRSI